MHTLPVLCYASQKIGDYVDVKIHDVSTVFFSCIFFASVGLKVTLGGMTLKVWMFAVILTLIAIISKMVGCGLGAKDAASLHGKSLCRQVLV